MLVALNCSLCSHQPSALSHSPAVTEGSDPTTVVSSRCPRAFTRRTQKPLSLLWNVTRSITPEIPSVAGLRSWNVAVMLGEPFSHGRLVCRAPLRKQISRRFGRRRVRSSHFLEHPPTALDIGIEVSNIESPWTGAAAVFDVQNQTLLNEIPELPFTDCEILRCLFGLHEPRRDGA